MSWVDDLVHEAEAVGLSFRTDAEQVVVRFPVSRRAELAPLIARWHTGLSPSLLRRGVQSGRSAREDASSASPAEKWPMPNVRPHFSYWCFQNTLREASQTGPQTI